MAANRSHIDVTVPWNDKRLLIGGGLALAVSCAVVGYVYWPRSDYKADLDRQIQESWMAGREVVDAWEFFENGGVYESDSRPAAEGVDQNYVIPLIKELREKHHLKVMAILRNDVPNTAMAVIAEAPPDRRSRNEVRATILETNDTFPGLVLQNWSHQWVSLDFLDGDEIKVLKPQTLERLKASQRRME